MTPDTDPGSLLRANVERVLKQQNRTVVSFCHDANMTIQQYYRAFKGPMGPTMATLLRWARALGVDAGELLREG